MDGDGTPADEMLRPAPPVTQAAVIEVADACPEVTLSAEGYQEMLQRAVPSTNHRKIKPKQLGKRVIVQKRDIKAKAPAAIHEEDLL